MHRQEWDEERTDRYLLAAKVTPFGVSYLDDALISLLPNELLVVGAKTGRGKTELATAMAYNMAARGKNVVFFALEADRLEIHRRIRYRKLTQLYYKHYGKDHAFKMPRYREWILQGYSSEWHAFEKELDNQIAIDSMTLRLLYKDKRYRVNEFLKEFEALEKETDIFFIDHLHYFDVTGTTETEGLKEIIHTIRDAAIHHGKPVILLSHLRKAQALINKTLPDLDDFHGHSDIVKVATTVLIISPVPRDKIQNDMGIFPTYFHIAKCRTAAEVTPYVAAIGFDAAENKYNENYYLQQALFTEDPKPIERMMDIPDWAKRAIRQRGPEIYGGIRGGEPYKD